MYNLDKGSSFETVLIHNREVKVMDQEIQSFPGLDRDIKVVLLDFDGTLYPSSSGIEKQIKSRFRMCARKRLNVSDKEIRKLLTKYRKEYKSSILGLKADYGIDPHDFYEELYGGLDVSLMSPKPGISEALEMLSQKIPLHVFSNSNKTFVKRGLDYLGLEKYIDQIFTVEDNNFIRKPNREVYEATINRVGVEPDKICMFDDIPSSLKMAKKVGFLTILVGNGLRETGFVDLHTGDEYDSVPEWCDFATRDIAGFIEKKMIT